MLLQVGILDHPNTEKHGVQRLCVGPDADAASSALMWTDSHCHLDAPEFDADRADVLRRARAAGVTMLVLPAVAADHFAAVVALARAHGLGYALGIHPLWTDRAADGDLDRLAEALHRHRNDPHLVAVGEIGLDFFVPALATEAMRAHQERIYRAQLRLARRFDLPVVLHVRRSADRQHVHLRELTPAGGWRGIAHAFNGSEQQAQAFISLGFALGFGGAMTFTRALQIRRLATQLPLSAVVLETDAPDISPAWLHPGVNTPAQLPRIAAVLAELRGQPLAEIAAQTSNNVARVLPRLGNLMMA